MISASVWREVSKEFGQKNITCPRCNQKFERYADYEKHIRNRQETYCLHCHKTFCTKQQIEKHQRSINEPREEKVDFERCIHPKTGFEDDPEFQELIDSKSDHIEDHVLQYTNHKVINRKIRPDFTYGELDDLLSDIYTKQKNSFKMNLGLGFVLYNIKTGQYKYHYTSANSLLFETATAITNIRDLEKFFKKIFDLDLQTNAYLAKPSSSWSLAGLTNLEIWIYEMKNNPFQLVDLRLICHRTSKTQNL